MSDSWSLKGKGVWKDYQFKMEEHWYSSSDIDILRQKLIEDVSSSKYVIPIQCGENKYTDFMRISKKQLIDVINKRFVVDE